MTEVSVVPEVWARLAHACDGSLTTATPFLAFIVGCLAAAKVCHWPWHGSIDPALTATMRAAGNLLQ